MHVRNLVIRILACASRRPVLAFFPYLAFNPFLLFVAFSGALSDSFHFAPAQPKLRRTNVIGISIKIGPSSSWRLSRNWPCDRMA